MGKQWDKCASCDGDGKCTCGSCRVIMGSGYDRWAAGFCQHCNGQGGRYVNSETGQPFEPDSFPSSDGVRRR